jgi:hypothetical protein
MPFFRLATHAATLSHPPTFPYFQLAIDKNKSLSTKKHRLFTFYTAFDYIIRKEQFINQENEIPSDIFFKNIFTKKTTRKFD